MKTDIYEYAASKEVGVGKLSRSGKKINKSIKMIKLMKYELN